MNELTKLDIIKFFKTHGYRKPYGPRTLRRIENFLVEDEVFAIEEIAKHEDFSAMKQQLQSIQI